MAGEQTNQTTPRTEDCPECEYCCLIGLCCPPEMQFVALATMLFRSGVPREHANHAATAIVEARKRAQKS